MYVGELYTFNLSSFPNQQYRKICDNIQAVYNINVMSSPLSITIEIEANLYKLAHTTSMLTANWRAIIFANL